MPVYNTTITPTSTGIKTVSPGFTPAAYEIIVSAKANDAYAHMSMGFVDSSGYASSHSFAEATPTNNGITTKTAGTSGTGLTVVTVYEQTNGAYGIANAASHDSFTSTAIKFNVTNVTSQYQYNIRIWG